MAIEVSLMIGGVAGLLIGIIASNGKIGCAALFLIPIAMIVYIAVWQSRHPESIRSTSALDFIFGPLWPSLSGLCGFGLVRLLRSSADRRNDS
jgi:hypothetical protein